MSALLALLASPPRGTSDVLGGTASRRVPMTSVLGLAQLPALGVGVPVAAGLLDGGGRAPSSSPASCSRAAGRCHVLVTGAVALTSDAAGARVSVTAVLASPYPVVTVLLAAG